MNILIIGGTGFIGQPLAEALGKDHRVFILSRNHHLQPHLIQDFSELEDPVDVIVNLGGMPLVEKRWTENVKEQILNSRLNYVNQTIEYIKNVKQKPSVFINASAIGYYGDSLTETFTESSSPATTGFPHQLCSTLESAASKAESFGVRVCHLRTGIVLGKNGGALAQMIPPFYFGLGATLGSGDQWMSWIHISDVVKAIEVLIHAQTLSGPFNLTAPTPVQNSDFTKILANIINRPTFLTLPNSVVRLMFGEMGEELLLKGQKVLPDKLLKSGYKFQYDNLKAALTEILAKKVKT
jgi:uncharacterized protein